MMKAVFQGLETAGVKEYRETAIPIPMSVMIHNLTALSNGFVNATCYLLCAKFIPLKNHNATNKYLRSIIPSRYGNTHLPRSP